MGTKGKLIISSVAVSVLVGSGILFWYLNSGPKGTITVEADLESAVYIDGERVGETPLGKIELPTGKHTIEIRHVPKPLIKRRTARVTADRNVRLKFKLKKGEKHDGRQSRLAKASAKRRSSKKKSTLKKSTRKSNSKKKLASKKARSKAKSKAKTKKSNRKSRREKTRLAKQRKNSKNRRS